MLKTTDTALALIDVQGRHTTHLDLWENAYATPPVVSPIALVDYVDVEHII